MQSQGMRFYSGSMHQLSVNSFAKGNVNNEASQSVLISCTISHRCDNQLRTLCVLCRVMVIMSVFQHKLRWLLMWEVDVVASKSGWLLRFPLSHFCLHCNEDDKLIALQVGSALINAYLTKPVQKQCFLCGSYHKSRWSDAGWLLRWMFELKIHMIISQCGHLALVFQVWFPRLSPMFLMSHRVQHWSIE